MKKILHLRFPLFFVLMFVVISSSGQDIHLSQYDAAPMYLNPAMTGKFNGRMRVHGHYRTQWKSIANNPYITTALSADRHMKGNFSLGAQIMNQKAGEGDFKEFRFLLSGAYDLIQENKRGHRVSVGGQLGIIQKSFDQQKLLFDSQYRPDNGGWYDPTLPSGEGFGSSSFMVPDMSVGLLYFYGGESSRFNPFFGVTALHINKPKESFFGADNYLPMRYVLHGGVKLNMSEKLQFIPKMWMQNQTNANEMTTSFVINYHLQASDSYLIFAPTWRKDDAAILELGMKYDDYIVRVSYDFNTSTLKPTTTGRGGFEISLTWIQEKKRPDPIPNCPRL
ncbi:MAG: PorP/SprF family type IX secretion system membrane protein [Flavobacteriales bacterium]|nr:PorP/SprF family type IX secretion system membrane protein [Flavobacteriales bacterium]